MNPQGEWLSNATAPNYEMLSWVLLRVYYNIQSGPKGDFSGLHVVAVVCKVILSPTLQIRLSSVQLEYHLVAIEHGIYSTYWSRYR